MTNKEIVKVHVYCENPMESFGFTFDSYEDAEGDIEERLRWGELEKVVTFYADGTTDVQEFEAWGA